MTALSSRPDYQEPELGYGQLLQILWRRAPWFVGALAGSVGIAAVTTLLRSPTYQSSMQLLVEPNVSQAININPNEGAAANSSAELALDYVTQLNLIRSKHFVEEVIRQYPNLCPSSALDSRSSGGSSSGLDSGQDGMQSGLDAATQKVCVEDFQASLTLSQIEENNTKTRIFEAVFTSDSALKAQESLQALQQIYLQYNQDQQVKRLDEGLALVNQQIEVLKDDLNNSQQALQQFRQAGGTIDPEQQSLEAATALDQLVQTRQAVQAEYREAEAQRAAIEAALSVDPQQATMAAKLSQSGRYQTLLDALQTSELALSERLAVYTEEDPVAQDLQAQRDRQVDLLREESQRLLGPAASTAGTQESDLLSNGQLGESGLLLVQEMINTQIKLSGLAAREASLAETQQGLQQQLDAYPALIAQYDRLQPDVETQRESLAQLLQTRQELSNEIAQGGFKWAVAESPDLGRKIAPKPKQNLALGAIAGLFLGGLLAYSREAVDTVVRTSEDLKRQTALPLLGVLPEIRETIPRFGALTRSPSSPFARSNDAPETALGLAQWQPFRESVDFIYKNIQLAVGSMKGNAAMRHTLRSVMVTSAIAREGKTTLALGLALSAARSQQRVLLIDADLRNPTLHHQLGLSNQQGLTTLLTSATQPLPVSVSLSGTQIDILTAGPFNEDPVRLLNSHRMRELTAGFENQYDLVVFDTSAVLGRVDALQVASFCQGVVMISRLDQITQDQLTQATAVLSRVNALGIVANSSRIPSSAAYSNTHRVPAIATPALTVSGAGSNGSTQNGAIPTSNTLFPH